MIKKLDHTCLIVRDLKRSIGFYRDLIGFKVLKVTEIKGEYPEKVLGVKGVKISYAKLRMPGKAGRGAPVLELHCWLRPRVSPQKNFSHISLGVKNMAAEYKRLRKKGVRFISKPLTAPDGHATICFGFDPDGNRIEFIEENPAQEAASTNK
jgi:lactoylglutathione lyase